MKKFGKDVFAGIVAVAITFGMVSTENAFADVCNAKPNHSKKSITNCMDKVNAGDVINILPGTYTDPVNGGYETFPIQMKAGVSLMGYGASNTIIVASNSNAIEGDSAGVVIKDLTIESNNGAAMHLTSMSTPDGVIIKNVNMLSTGSGQAGIRIDNNTESVLVEGCNITGADWVVSIGSTEIKEVKIIDTNMTDNSNGRGEAPIGISKVLDLVIRNVEINGWPDTAQIWAHKVLIDNLDIADNSTMYISSIPGHTAEVLIRNSRLGDDTTESTYFRGNAQYGIFNSQLNAPVTSSSQIELKLLNCYHKGLSPIPNI